MNQGKTITIPQLSNVNIAVLQTDIADLRQFVTEAAYRRDAAIDILVSVSETYASDLEEARKEIAMLKTSTIESLLAENKKMFLELRCSYAALVEVEWSGICTDRYADPACPVCHARKEHGHMLDCLLAKAFGDHYVENDHKLNISEEMKKVWE